MFTVIQESNLYLETIKDAALAYEKWSFVSAYSDKIRLKNCGEGSCGLSG